MKRVVICWAGISGYLAAGWRALAAVEDIDLHVVTYGPKRDSMARFDDSLLEGVPCTLLEKEALLADPAMVEPIVSRHEPDVVVIPGWMIPAYRRLPSARSLSGARFVLGMDTPWRGTWRQRMARWRLAPLLRRVDRVMVTGERCWQYARHLGVPERAIRRGVYGIDYDAFASAGAQRCTAAEGWPRHFIYVGRYVKSKGLDVLLKAYQRYRECHEQPFALSCCGSGPLQAQLAAAPGVTDHGFVQPADLPRVLSEQGVFVMASRFDPWPLAIVEACASGLPVICTEACGSSVELIRPYDNGLTVPTDDADALAAAMSWMHAHTVALPAMGQRGQALAAAYRPQLWARRMAGLVRELTPE